MSLLQNTELLKKQSNMFDYLKFLEEKNTPKERDKN